MLKSLGCHGNISLIELLLFRSQHESFSYLQNTGTKKPESVIEVTTQFVVTDIKIIS